MLGDSHEVATALGLPYQFAHFGDALLTAGETPQLFVRAGSAWQEQALPTDCDEAGTYYGRPAALDADTALVNGNQQVCVFVRAGESWSTQQLLPFLADLRYEPGALAVSGDTAMVGALGRPGYGLGGKVYVYERSGTVWSLSQTLQRPADVPSNSDFGYGIVLSSDTAIISGGRGPHVFSRSSGSWELKQTLTAADRNVILDGSSRAPPLQQWLPPAIQLSGDRALVGCTCGSIEYLRSGTTWVEGATLSITAGYRVLSVLGDLALLGDPGPTAGRLISAPLPNPPSPSSSLGAAQVARRSGDAWEPLLELPTRHVNFGFSGALFEFGAVVGSLHTDIGHHFQAEGPSWSLDGPGWLTYFELGVADGTCDVDAHCPGARCVGHLCVPLEEPEASGGAGGMNAVGGMNAAGGGEPPEPSQAGESANGAGDSPQGGEGGASAAGAPVTERPVARVRGGCHAATARSQSRWQLLSGLFVGFLLWRRRSRT